MSGEFDRIGLFLRAFRDAGGSVEGGVVSLGPGDDCAILTPLSRPSVVTADAIVEDVHFRRAWATPEQIGHKALAVNLSDLASMGAAPATFTCALGVPPDVTDADLAGIARGMGALAGRFGAVLCGGNFTRARELSITITAFGLLEGPALLRSAARPGDRVLLVGEVGVAGAELLRLERGERLPEGRSAVLSPEPLVDAGVRAARHARCGIDVSDGLAQDLGHVARASGGRVVVEAARIPRSDRFRALVQEMPAAEQARLQLAGGEDYALVVIAEPGAAGLIVRELGAADVGHVEAGAGVVIRGAPDGLALGGHDHFAGP